MGQAKSPDSAKAEKLYRKGMRISEIAKKLGIAPNTVSNWKKRYNWDAEPSQNDVTNNHKKSQKTVTKKGGQSGNKNAIGNKGGKGQYGNTNALNKGAYSNPHLDVLDDDEKALLDVIPIDEEALCIQQIQILTIRENRILKAIAKYRQNDTFIERTTRSEALREFKDEWESARYDEISEMKIESGEKMPGHGYEVEVITENSTNMILRLEKELTSVQRAKTRCIENLHTFMQDKANLAMAQEKHPLEVELLDARIEQVDANTLKLLGENVELEDVSATDQMVFGGKHEEES